MENQESEGQPVKDCRDTLIWIGRRYYPKIVGIDPGESIEFLFPPEKKWPRDCYVHEAEIRGCCRKVPVIPAWLTPKKSHVFLVHQNGKKRGCGSLFGYYVFDRVEVAVPWRTRKIGKGISLPRRITNFEALRSCGRRPNKTDDTRAKYLVDSLAADIIDKFRVKLGSGTYTEEKKHAFFIEAVKEAGKMHNPSSTNPHNLIKNDAKVRGELVLFNKIEGEYPIIARRPRAHFRGLTRVDGEKLIEEIEEWYSNNGEYTVRIPYCDNGAKIQCNIGATWTPALFAFEYGFSIRRAEDILREHCNDLRHLSNGKSFPVVEGEFNKENGNLNFKPLVSCYRTQPNPSEQQG